MGTVRLALLRAIPLAVAVAPVVSAQVPSDKQSRPQIIRGSPNRDRAFAAQPIDPEWAPAVESLLEDILEASPMEFSSTEVECRTSMCRAVLTHPFETFPPGFQEMLAELSKPLHSAAEQDPRIRSISMSSELGRFEGDSITTTIYFGQ